MRTGQSGEGELGLLCGIGILAMFGWWGFMSTPLYLNHQFQRLIGIPRPKTATEVSVTRDFVISKIEDYALKARLYEKRFDELETPYNEAETKLARAREFGNFFTAQDYKRLQRELAAAKSESEKAHDLLNKAQGLLWDACRAGYDTEYFRMDTKPESCPDILRWDERGGDPF